MLPGARLTVVARDAAKVKQRQKEFLWIQQQQQQQQQQSGGDQPFDLEEAEWTEMLVTAGQEKEQEHGADSRSRRRTAEATGHSGENHPRRRYFSDEDLSPRRRAAKVRAASPTPADTAAAAVGIVSDKRFQPSPPPNQKPASIGARTGSARTAAAGAARSNDQRRPSLLTLRSGSNPQKHRDNSGGSGSSSERARFKQSFTNVQQNHVPFDRFSCRKAKLYAHGGGLGTSTGFVPRFTPPPPNCSGVLVTVGQYGVREAAVSTAR